MKKNLKIAVLSSTVLFAICMISINGTKMKANAATTVSDLVGTEVVSIEKDATGKQTLTYNTSPGWDSVNFNVTNYVNTDKYFEMKATFSSDTKVCFEFNGNINWDVGHKLYAEGEQFIQISLDSYGELPTNFTAKLYIDSEVTVNEEKTITIESYKFVEKMTVLDVPYSISDITGNTAVSVTKQPDNTQLIKYSTPPGYELCNINVEGYKKEKPIFEITLTASESLTICLVINGVIDWDVGHATYGASETTIKVDTRKAIYSDLPTNFSIGIYFDAEATTIEKEKNILVKEYGFKAVSTDFVIEDGVGVVLNSVKNASNEYDVSWINNGKDYRRLSFDVKNHTNQDLLVVYMSTIKGRSMGITLTLDDGTTTEVRNHWSTDQGQHVFSTTEADAILVYNLNAFPELKEKVIANISLYFDPPTNLYSYNMTDEAKLTVKSVELKKSSELTLANVTVTANEIQTFDYDGKLHVFEVTNDKNVKLNISYKPALEPTKEWTDNAPKNAGEYFVRIQYVGSLEYNYLYNDNTYKVVINKANLVATKELIDFDEVTGDLEYDADEVIVSTTSDFKADSILKDIDKISEDTTVYVKYIDNSNHFESKAIQVELKLQKNESGNNDSSSSSSIATSEFTKPSGSTSEDKVTKNNEKKGCKGTVGGLATSLIALGTTLFIKRKKHK